MKIDIIAKELAINYLSHLEENKKRILEISSNPDIIIKKQFELIIATAVIAEENNKLVMLINKLSDNLLSKFPHKETTEKVIKDIQKMCSIIITKIDDKIIMIKNICSKRGIKLN